MSGGRAPAASGHFRSNRGLALADGAGMKRSTTIIANSLLGLSMSLGCSVASGVDGGQPVGPDGGASLTGAVATFCTGTFAKRAQLVERCCSALDRDDRRWGVDIGIVTSADLACQGDLSASLSKGRVAFDAAALAACLSDVASDPTSCSRPSVLLPLPASCSTVIHGLQDSSSACAHDYECKDGLVCSGHTGSSDGECRVPPAHGKTCGTVADAAATPFELPIGGNHPKCAGSDLCYEGKCVTGALIGSGCSLAGYPGPCAPGLACVDLGLTYRTCVSTDGSEGAPCEWPRGCGEGFGCSNQTCVRQKANGQPCDLLGDECLGNCEGTFSNLGSAGTCVAFCGSPG